jgi:hypothetical protein
MIKFILDPTPITGILDGDWDKFMEDVESILGEVDLIDGVFGELFPGPTFEMVSCPTIQISEIKARRFYIVDRSQILAKEAIQKEEDQAIFNAINAAIPT